MALSARRRRQVAAAAVALAVLALHALGLRAWAPAPSPAAPPEPATAAPPGVAMQVRAVAPAPPAVEHAGPEGAVRVAVSMRVTTPPATDPGVGEAAGRVPAATPAPAGASVPIPAPSSVDANPDPAPSTASEPALATTTDRPAEAVVAALPAAPTPREVAETPAAPTKPVASLPSGDALPLYPTKLPPSFRWTFRMQRGIVSGTGSLTWELHEARYRLALVGSVAGLSLLEWVSQGGIDRAGVAPERFVSQARGRSAQAINFQRGAGKVTYSASSAEHPLPLGVQDRVSWLVQLAAVVAAAPERHAAPGTTLTFAVAGSRDVGLWQFVGLGAQTVETPAGRVETLAFRREARHAYDTRGEVWLDPHRHHLPVRVVLSTVDGHGRVGDALELALESTTP